VLSLKEQIVLQTVADYSARLGIPCPNVEFERRKGRARRYVGKCFHEDHAIYVKVRGCSVRYIRHTVAHELVHLAFEGKPCQGKVGRYFERYVKALQRGCLVFNGRGLIA
jgi:hypothetical protein